MLSVIKHIRLLLIAVTALALSAGLAFGATPPAASSGLANAGAHAGKTVPVAGEEGVAEDDEDVEEEEDTEDLEDTDEADVDEAEDAEDAEEAQEAEGAEDVEGADDPGEHCATDPTLLTPEDLDAMNHGSIVCWAAHQAEWPEWFGNHGAFVRCWAQHGKADAPSCTDDPDAADATVEEPTGDQVPTAHGKGHGKGTANKAKGKSKHRE